MHAELLILRVVHILGGIFWVGSGLFNTFYLLPALRDVGPAGAQIMASMQKRKMLVVLPTVAILTMLSGIRLMMITPAGFSRPYLAMASGKTYAVSGLMAITGFLLGMVVARPAAGRIAKLSQMTASDGATKEKIAAEIQMYQRRAMAAGTGSIFLLLLAAIGMAVARYL